MLITEYYLEKRHFSFLTFIMQRDIKHSKSYSEKRLFWSPDYALESVHIFYVLTLKRYDDVKVTASGS